MYSSRNDFDEAYSVLLETFASNRTKSLAWRQWQLKQCWWMLTDYEDRIVEALKKDLNRHPWEVHAADILGLKQDILHTLAHFRDWVRDEKPSGGAINWLGNATIRKEPLGLSLIIGAWNFPFLLLLQPMIAAIAAGCPVMLKPSELAPASQELLVEMIPKYLDSSAIRVITAGPDEMAYLLDHKFNHIFYTGSAAVAKIISRAACRFLTPLVLELGGQGPAIVTRSANLDLAAKRIAAAKFTNAGQICLNTNHVFVPKDLQSKFAERLAYWFDKYSGGSQEAWSCFASIINERHFDRITRLLDESGGSIQYGGQRDRSTKFIQPTVVTEVTMDDSLMSQELFAPILPVVTAEVGEAIEHIKSLPHPLAIYIFSNNKKEIEHILNNTQSGGVTLNDCMIHAGVDNAPFGGVGEAGVGYYHGEYGVRAFSHLRTVVGLPSWADSMMAWRYPPYSMKNLGKLGIPSRPPFKRGERMEDQKSSRKGSTRGWLASVALLAAVAAATMYPF